MIHNSVQPTSSHPILPSDNFPRMFTCNVRQLETKDACSSCKGIRAHNFLDHLFNLFNSCYTILILNAINCNNLKKSFMTGHVRLTWIKPSHSALKSSTSLVVINNNKSILINKQLYHLMIYNNNKNIVF